MYSLHTICTEHLEAFVRPVPIIPIIPIPSFPPCPGPPSGTSPAAAPLPREGRAGPGPPNGGGTAGLSRRVPAPLGAGAAGLSRRPNVQTGPAPGGPAGPARFRFRGLPATRPGQPGPEPHPSTARREFEYVPVMLVTKYFEKLNLPEYGEKEHEAEQNQWNWNRCSKRNFLKE
ncbi:collagen alpha-1(I) chain-like [Corapipo altera]|uniref:collagen alpha-1(I) chain-like n=1 Tax=Corapipo altera TaxID=415028 RepID=UPI000FD647E3|nr:collagen alpha-1(I) chain-like [Corapipo altera]